MKKKEKEKELCSLDEEMLLWTSYRYCIGRKTYVSSLAGYMAKKYYPILSKNGLENNAFDIRRCILDNLQFSPFNFQYEGTVPTKERKPLTTQNLQSANSATSLTRRRKTPYQAAKDIFPGQVLPISAEPLDLILCTETQSIQPTSAHSLCVLTTTSSISKTPTRVSLNCSSTLPIHARMVQSTPCGVQAHQYI